MLNRILAYLVARREHQWAMQMVHTGLQDFRHNKANAKWTGNIVNERS